jgi:beta-barrel assembly-enhancing protease
MAGPADGSEYLRNHPALAHTVKHAEKLHKSMSRGLKFLLWGSAAMGVGCLALILNLGTLANAAAQKLPKDQEIKLGKALSQEFRLQALQDVPPELKAMLDKATVRLLPVVQSSGYKFEFHVIEDNSLNAFAVPGGQIFIHTGLLKAAKRPEQVAGVLAHEMAHVTKRHTLRNILQKFGLSAVINILTGGTDVGTLVGASDYLLSQKFSRDMEREADDTGWEYMKQAKIDPTGLIEFFEVMKKQEAAAAGIPDLISTHPATQERINGLKEKLRQLPADHKTTPL